MRPSRTGATPVRVTRTGAALALLLAGAALAAGCGSSAARGPRPTAVVPDHGPLAMPVVVRIRGEGFRARVTTDFGDPAESGVDARYRALLGSVALQDVALQPDGELTATVPAGLASGLYDVTVVDPWGRAGTLPQAYRVVVPSGGNALVASYQVETVGPQEAFRPFGVTIAALDAAGAVVTDFNGEVRLTELTGTGVPATAARFVAGRWTGLLEVRAPHGADVLTVADDQGAAGRSNPFAVASPRPVAARFATPPAATTAGRCAGPVRLVLQDAFGQPVQADQATALAVATAPSAGLTLYADAACGAPVGSPTVAAGSGALDVWFVATRAGALDLAVSGGGLATSVQRQTVAADAPAALEFLTQPQALNAGACSRPATVEVRDRYGNPSPPGTMPLSLGATPAGGVTFSSDPSCSGAAPSLEVAGGATRTDFYFTGTTAQLVGVTVAGAGVSPAWQEELVTADGKASLLGFVTPPRAAAAGACSEEVSLQTQDSYGNAVAGAGAVQVTLSASPAAGFATYADPGCTVPAATIQIGAGQSTGGFHYRGTLAGNVAITVSSTTLTGATQAETVRPGTPAQVVFASGPQSVPAGSCSAAVRLEVRDALGNAAPLGAPAAVALSLAPAGDAGLYADPACTQPISGVTVAASASTASFHFRGTLAGALAITAAPSGLSGATQSETIRAAVASRLAFTSAPQALVAGACSGAATLEIRDTLGNVATVPGGMTVSLAAAPVAGFAFFRDAACSVPAPTVVVPAGGSGVGFFFAGTAPGTIAVTASAAGLDPDTQRETVRAAPPVQLAFATDGQTVLADACSGPVALESRDPFGNPSPVSATAATAIGLAASPAAGITLYAGADCGGAAVSAVPLAAGASATTFSFRSTAAGSVTLTASAAPLRSAAQVETVVALAADHVAFRTAPQTQLVGACSAPVTIRTEDGHGNASPVAAATPVGLAAAPGTGFAFYSDAACTAPVAVVTLPAGGPSASFYFKGTVAGTVTVAVSPAGMATATQREDVVADLPDHLVFTSAAQTVGAAACSADVALQVVDAYGNASPVQAATDVALSASPSAGVSFFAGGGCSGPAVSSVSVGAGASTTRFSFRGTASGAITVTASAAGMSPSPTQAETIVPGAPDHLAFTSAPQTVTAGACSGAVTLQALDAQGNAAPVSAATAVALAASPSTGVSFFAGPGCAGAAVSSVSIAAGASVATLSFRASATGSFTVNASGAGMSAGPSQTETVVAAAPDHLVFTSAAQTVAAGACSAEAGLEVVDAAGNPVAVPAATAVTLAAAPSAGVSFFAGAGCSGAAVSSVSVAAAARAATFSFRATASGSLTITATAAGLSPSPSQVETIAPGAPDHLAFTTAAQSLTAGACSAEVGLQALDASGNVAPVAAGTAVTLTASPAAGIAFFAGAGCSGAAVSSVAIAPGASTATFSFRGTASGRVTVAAAAAGLATGASQDETVGAAALDHLSWDVIPSPQALGVPFPVTVTARDAFGNAATSFTGTATLSVSAGTLTCSSSCTSATLTGKFTAGVWTGSVAVSPQGSGLTLQATAGSAAGTSSAFDVTGPASRSPPTARLTVSPAVIVSGNAAALDASGSSDHQTAAAQLSVSWDFEAVPASMDAAAAPPASPWTAWSTTKTATHAFINNGSAPVVLHPRVAVRDTEAGPGGPDVAYASATVVVLQNGNGHCVVDTSSDVDDGATSCYARGSDGRLSFREAVRLANASSAPIAISFSGPMTIAASGTLSLTRPVYVVAQPGVALDTATLSISGSGVLISGLELSRPASAVVVAAGADATFRDVYLHDGAGLQVSGRARLDRVRVSGCSGTCIVVDGTDAYLSLFGSALRGSGSNTGVELRTCATAVWSLGAVASPYQPYDGAVMVAANVFSEFGTAIASSCLNAALTNNTFIRNGTGVDGFGAFLLDSIFSGQTVGAVTSPMCPGFAISARHVVWRNASGGCLAAEAAVTPAADVTFSADPLFIFPADGDYRIQYGSPAKDWGRGANNVDLDGPGPARFLGANADRGGRETY